MAAMAMTFSVITAAALIFSTTPANAQRPPTAKERAAIAHLVRADLGLPASAADCVSVAVRVSTANENWAYGSAVFRRTSRCLRFASNGFALLSWQRLRGWRIDYRGSVPPRCRSVVPAAVTRDLLKEGCQRA